MKRNNFFQTILIFLVFFLVLVPECYLAMSDSFEEKKPISMGNGAWMHVDTFFNKTNQQIQSFAEMLKTSNINNIFILGKNIDGTLTYPSKVGLKCYKEDTMRFLVTVLNANHIKTYFYFPINTDPCWLKKNPGSVAYQCGTKKSKTLIPEPTHKLVNLTDKGYQLYIKKVIDEALTLYPIQGIQLDYIRYSNGYYGFSADEIKEASSRGIPIQKIIDLTYKTFVNPGDWKTILTRYEESDPDVLAWAKLREDIVYQFLASISSDVKKKNKECGTTLVSSGASSKAYTAIHFGDIMDINRFVTEVCHGALEKINPACKIAIGLQAYLTSTQKMMEAIYAVKKSNLGFVLFRIGTFSFNGLDLSPIDKNHTLLQLTINNCLEGSPIKGLTLMQTGNCIHFSDLQKNWKLHTTDINSIKLVTADPIQFGSNVILNFKIDFDLGKLNHYFSPFVVLSSATNDFPTYNFRFFSTNQLTYDLIKRESHYNQVLQKEGFIQYLQNKCWIDVNHLPFLFDFVLMVEQDTVFINNGNTTLSIDKNKRTSSFSLGEKKCSLPKDYLFISGNLLPLKELCELFKITVLYDAVENKVHCINLNREIPTTLYGNLFDISPLDLFVTDTDEIITTLDSYLDTSFYKQNSKFHLLGRSIKVLSKKEVYSSKDSESIFLLIEESKERLILPDELSYLCTSKADSLGIPLNRELILVESSFFDFHEYKHKNLRIMTTIQNLDDLSNLYEYYVDLSNCKLPDWQNLKNLSIQFKIKGIYFLHSSQF